MRQMDIEMGEDQTLNKRISPFFVKDILGLSDDSETESVHDSSDDISNRDESGNEDNHIEDADDANNNGKKTRQCFTSKQVEELERLFHETNYPDAYTRQMLAKKMKVSESRIQIWCQNRRAKIRRQRKQRKPMLSGVTTPHGVYYQPSSPWLHSHYTSVLPFHPVLPLSSRHSLLHSPVGEKSRLYYRTDYNKDDMLIEHSEYTRTRFELEESYGRMRSFTK